MQSVKKPWLLAAALFLVIVCVAGFSQLHQKPTQPLAAAETSPLATSTVPVATTTTVKRPASSGTQSFPINPSDKIVSWDFKGAYAGNADLEAQAAADKAKLEALMGTSTYDDYDLYIGLGNDDNLLGDGAGAYKNFNRSISIHPKKGLAYVNLAHLMDELGAYETAADAYSAAVSVEPGMLEYHLERLKYLTRQFGADTARIINAFADANKQFGDTAPVIAIEASWLTAQGHYPEAVKAWELVKTLSPGKDMSAVDAEIARLEAKQ
ncbi:MAG: hypothetical protein KGH56_02815 [Patescibacteria group bacterium]|nr:hypothetical protein [Patescibacteria group bacterium]